MDSTSANADSGPDEGFDSWAALQKATDEPRANLIADVVGHPTGAPSVPELDHTNPSLGTDAIRRHLGVLQDVGVVETLVVEPGNRIRGFPYKFYRLTGDARALFDRNDLFPREAWQRRYDRVQKPGGDPGDRRDASSRVTVSTGRPLPR